MMGLHPTHVKENYEEELKHIEEMLTQKPFIAVGEIGIDLYWDKTTLKPIHELEAPVSNIKKPFTPLILAIISK